MKTVTFAVALGAAIISAGAGAKAAGSPREDVTRQQVQQMVDSMFARFDANHDGVLTRAEADQAIAKMSSSGGRASRKVGQLFGNAPSITRAQAEAAAMARFDAQDLNHDGVVSVAERQQAKASRHAAQ